MRLSKQLYEVFHTLVKRPMDKTMHLYFRTRCLKVFLYKAISKKALKFCKVFQIF